MIETVGARGAVVEGALLDQGKARQMRGVIRHGRGPHTPLWSVWAPAMPDYPAHLASFSLIEQGTFHHGAARANGLYHLQWSFVPNLASEIMVPLLAQLTGVAAATKLFLTLSLFLW